ncbi:M16 family metallopeptidase [Paraglaciecola psychrophila]|uniref:Pseudouridine synthase, Rsu n=1 Tax=Paraglaciecola psychrophila 170 TaxID=1129794 RepID=K6YXS1_9ALTE|nr:pitrilysin family protein [Paraglaciecola psychrophila]AGH45860.1 pseudouridine synthase, Rsu [Paraglaciecola psychrophila 170]GAC37519.1 mitochondrial processing peptidase [Paraglaciecola psychrophila 170]
MFNRPFFTGAVMSITLTVSALAFANDKFEKVTEVEGISEYNLDNGLQVLLFPDQTKETVTVNVTYHVGSKHENYGETGMAHLLEHLVFKGSPKHKDIPAELSSHGARPNGTTWTDRTNYFETFSANEKNINWALSMESDRMVNSFIAKKDLDSEMTVVRNEFERGENSPFRITLQKMAASAYMWHNYGKSTIGARSDLENVPIDRLKAFYKMYYQPDNATLIVAGKFEEVDMIALVDKYFSPIPKPERVIRLLYTAEPAQDGEKSVTIRRVGDVQMTGAAYHIPAGSHDDYAAIDVLSQILGDTPSGRLHKVLVEGKLASRVYGFNFQWQEPGLAIYFAEVDKKADLSSASDAMVSVLEELSAEPITDEEVERSKRNLLKNIELSFNSSERIALNLSEWLGMGDWRLYFLHRDRIEQVTTSDVQRVANTYLQRNNRTAGHFIPTEKPARIEIPTVISVNDMVKDYQGRAKIAAGEVFEPSFDNIDSRTVVTQLSNGSELSLLSKKTRGESVVASIMMSMGTEKSLQNLASVGDATSAMLMRGTSKLSRQDIQDEFDKLKTQVSVSGGADWLVANITTTRENLSSALLLMHKILSDPGFDKTEFEQYKSTLKVDIEKNLQDPQQLAFNEYGRKQNPYKKGHPNYQPTFAEDLESIQNLKLSDLKTFHQSFFGGNHMKIGVVGDFDQAQIKTDLENLYGSWKSKSAYLRVEDPYIKVAASPTDFDTPDKENATFVAAIMLPVGENSDDAAALELGNYIFGGGFLNSRLATRLRQKDGLSYGAGSFITMNPEDNKATLGAYAICAPQNLAKVEVGFNEELSRMLKDGFTDEEIKSAKSGLLQGKKVSRAQDPELVRTLRRNLLSDRTMQWNKAYEQRLAALTADDVKRVMNKYLKIENFSIIKAGDMSKVEG